MFTIFKSNLIRETQAEYARKYAEVIEKGSFPATAIGTRLTSMSIGGREISSWSREAMLTNVSKMGSLQKRCQNLVFIAVALTLCAIALAIFISIIPPIILGVAATALIGRVALVDYRNLKRLLSEYGFQIVFIARDEVLHGDFRRVEPSDPQYNKLYQEAAEKFAIIRSNEAIHKIYTAYILRVWQTPSVSGSVPLPPHPLVNDYLKKIGAATLVSTFADGPEHQKYLKELEGAQGKIDAARA